MAIINFNSISGISTISVASSITVGTGVTITATNITAPTFTGNVTGNLTGNVNASGLSTFSNGIQVGATTSVVVGSTFIRANSIGIGSTSTAGRNAGIGTVDGTIIYNATTKSIEAYGPTGWSIIKGLESFIASGGTESTTVRSNYKVHTYTSTNPFVVTTGTKECEILVVAGGGSGGIAGRWRWWWRSCL